MRYSRTILVLWLVGLAAGWNNAQEVETEYGTVRGQTIPVELSTDVFPVTSFWGIPFARPPVEDLRFAPPQKAVPWSGVFVADTLPNACMQNPLSLDGTHPGWSKFSEDCLTLNIFAPQVTDIPHSVMVWIHGGSYTSGAGFQNPGHFLAAHDVIVVTLNYRLGVFGFASTSDGTIPGNMGMLDQVMALEFVRDNIAAFGGNPKSVTIIGESAGAYAAALLLVSPKTKGLFHSGILESGAETSPGALNPPQRRPEEYIYQVADNADCPTATTGEMLMCLRALSAEQLRLADRIKCTPGYYCKDWAPVVDGPGGFMPDLPLKLKEQLGTDTVPVLSGICKDDGSMFIPGKIPEMIGTDGFTREEFELYLRTRYVDQYAPSLTPEQTEAVYNAMDFQYTPHPYLDDLGANRQAFIEIETDSRFGFSWDRQAKLNQEHADTYAYVFSYLSPNSTSSFPEWMGITHVMEMYYVFGYPYMPSNAAVRNDSEFHVDAIGWVDDDRLLADYMLMLWTNFVKYQNPTPAPIKAPFDETLTTWHKFKTENNFKVMYLDREISIVDLYRQYQYAFYTSYLPKITGRTFL